MTYTITSVFSDAFPNPGSAERYKIKILGFNSLAAGQAPEILSPLALYWSRASEDNFTTATIQGEESAQVGGYGFARIEGYVLSTFQPGTVPLKLFWHAGRSDNFTTATARGEQDALAGGYKFARIEGYVYPAQ